MATNTWPTLAALLLGFVCCFTAPVHTVAAEAFSLPDVVRSVFPEQALHFYYSGEQPAHDDGALQESAAAFTDSTRKGAVFTEAKGRSGALAVNSLLRQQPNGYSLALIRLPDFYLHVTNDTPLYKQQEIVPLVVYAAAPLALWVRAGSAHHDFASLWADLRNGKTEAFFIAGTGSETASRMANEQLNRAAGVETHFMPLADTAQALKAVEEGRVKACWAPALAPSTMPGLRALAVAGQARMPALPHTPTFIESGCPLEQYVYFGVAMASAVPEKIRAHATHFLERVLTGTAFQKQLQTAGFVALRLQAGQLPALLRQQQTAVAKFMEAYSAQ